MSQYLENPWQRLLQSQVFVIIYAAIAAVLGITLQTFLLALLIIVVATYLQNRLFGKNPFGSARPEEVLSAKRLYEEKNARELQAQDEGLYLDMQPQLRFMMWMNLSLLPGLAYFFLAWGRLGELQVFLRSYLDSELLVNFLAFLLYMEGFFIINQVALLLAARRVGRVEFISYPSEYTVTASGIVYKAFISSSALPFPLPDNVKVRLDEKRGFVDLVNEGKRSSTVVRLYARNPKRLYEILKRHGSREGA
ncbi:MAG: DUF2208 domain-containing protein [Acidilobaceae archaeon]|nr:DUF2208 domain-containing protein [Acidilobaceae archaeon]